jgi:hypothetical protein
MSKLCDEVIADVFGVLSDSKSWDEFWDSIDAEARMQILGRIRIKINERLEES